MACPNELIYFKAERVFRLKIIVYNLLFIDRRTAIIFLNANRLNTAY